MGLHPWLQPVTPFGVKVRAIGRKPQGGDGCFQPGEKVIRRLRETCAHFGGVGDRRRCARTRKLCHTFAEINRLAMTAQVFLPNVQSTAPEQD